jgi:chemotaxis protein CheX
VNPFVGSAFSVIETVTGDRPQRGQLSARDRVFRSQAVTIITGVTGGLQGQVLYGMTRQAACSIAGAMLGKSVQELDELGISALAELANMVSGNASTKLAEAGYLATITPPSVVQGEEIKVLTVERALIIPVITQYGEIEINVALQEGN